MIRTLLGKKVPASRWALSVGLGSSLLALGNASAQQVSNPTTSQAPETAAARESACGASYDPLCVEYAALVDAVAVADAEVALEVVVLPYSKSDQASAIAFFLNASRV